MNKLTPEQVKNFRKQSEQASVSEFMRMAIYGAYRKEYPDKITIVMDEITLHDPKHFREWSGKK